MKNLADAELSHLLDALDKELDGVEMRLRQLTASKDSLAAMLATQQLEALGCWRPAVKGLKQRLSAPQPTFGQPEISNEDSFGDSP